jgi:hypothetical protein
MIRALMRVWLVGAVMSVGCADTDLYRPKTDEVQRGVGAVEGRFCTEDPATLIFPVKVWFIIDDSGSMQQSDPNQKRFSEAKAVATRLAEPGRMFWGAETFAGNTDGAKRVTQPARFTDSPTTFSSNIDAVANAGSGGTPYLAALNFAYGELSDEVRKDPALARRTRFVVIFLSDGVPTDSEQPQILEALATMMSLRRDVGGITLNTVFLGGAGGSAATTILEAMARSGEGTFKSFVNGDALTFDSFDLSGIRRNYAQRFFAVMNRSVVATAEGPAIDSDLDGVSDVRELAAGSDPTLRDTDGDSCSDAMELRVGWSPRIRGSVNNECTCSTSELGDQDGDELSDCEERWLGTSKRSPDSDLGPLKEPDGDWITDALDSALLGDPGGPNDTTDRDIDGVPDMEEFRTHTAVQALDVSLHERYAYRYVQFAQDRLNARCYEFKVENVWLGETAATASTGKNENVIEVYFGQSPEDEPWKERTFHVARKSVRFDGKNVQVAFTPEDFKHVLRELGEALTGP